MKPINNVHMIAEEQHKLSFGGVYTGTEMECIAHALINQYNTYTVDFEERENAMDTDEHSFVLGEMTKVYKLIHRLQKETGFMWVEE